MELAEKVAIVTGGGYGIGREIALACSKAGANVVLAARTQKPLDETRDAIEKIGGRVLVVPTDISREVDCARMVERTIETFNHLDILVNNAGIAGATKPITEMALAEWQEVIDINLTGAWLASRAAVPVMLKQASGNILMISSGAGRRGYPLRAPYAASKWAMIGLTQTLALEWGMKKIRVNCIRPGATEGPRIERVIQARAEAFNQPYEKVKAAFTGSAAQQRIVTEQEIAKVATFIVSDLASGVTGQTINVD